MRSFFSENLPNGLDLDVGNEEFLRDQPCLEIMLGRESSFGIAYSNFKLISNYLIELNNSKIVIKVTDLTKSIFNPFEEEKNGHLHYGFFLDSQPYFTDCETSLVLFYKAIKNICILTNIESELVFLKKIGKGSTCTVYLARSILKNSEFAVKCVKKSALDSIFSIQSIYREISILRQLKHPNICKLFYVFEDQENLYLVFEYISSCSLLKYLLKNKRLSEFIVEKLIRNILRTVEYLHKKEVIHRDIKLENIMIVNEETLEFKLIDFGISYRFGDLLLKKCGSPGYIAPEILRNEAYDYKIDIFSIGVVMFVLLHGRLPFDSDSLEKTMNNNLKGKVSYGKQLSESAKSILDDMLNPMPQLRPSASELLMDPWFGKMTIRNYSTSNLSSIDFTS